MAYLCGLRLCNRRCILCLAVHSAPVQSARVQGERQGHQLTGPAVQLPWRHGGSPWVWDDGRQPLGRCSVSHGRPTGHLSGTLGCWAGLHVQQRAAEGASLREMTVATWHDDTTRGLWGRKTGCMRWLELNLGTSFETSSTLLRPPCAVAGQVEPQAWRPRIGPVCLSRLPAWQQWARRARWGEGGPLASVRLYQVLASTAGAQTGRRACRGRTRMKSAAARAPKEGAWQNTAWQFGHSGATAARASAEAGVRAAPAGQRSLPRHPLRGARPPAFHPQT